jgi:serine/threonine protein kinase/formylglycine-generating enzyme required for sulfatase activity
MHNKDDFATTPGPNDPDQTNLSQNEKPENDADEQTADYRTSAGSSPAASCDKPSENKSTNSTDKSTTSVPMKVGRYAIKRLLGRGGFGEVYLGFDEQLQRDVAIKLTFGSRVSPKATRMFMAEARMLAELDHPNIVPVFDIGTTDGGDIYIVSKLIDGTDLANRIEKDRPSRELALEIIGAIAEALHYAHSKGLIHRDIKPANILLDKTDRPYLADFGIALRETDQVGSGEITGTPAYMSPEQARGEGHLMSNQSDIYSLGLVLYELLAGRRPYRGKTAQDLLRMAQVGEVRPPRTFDSTITKELERVCLKALARRPSDRYAIARDFAQEVRSLVANHLAVESSRTNPSSAIGPGTGSVGPNASPTPSDGQKVSGIESDQQFDSIKIIPRGLRSFEPKDSEFFLELLPGPFDRFGLPESLRFWKDRIESPQIEESFRIGLMYGPSGCGKSSLMKAGLLPRLSPKIERVYVEATPEDTPARLLSEVQKIVPEAVKNNLVETLNLIRRRKLVPSGGKLLLVIDQFEQWLHSHDEVAGQELTDALRQCDGVSVQAILMVRDDFWLSVSRFLKELDVPILERENAALVDLFDLDHAKRVLALFGQAYERLDQDRSAWTEPQKQFLQTAVDGLAENRKVISVRLALFAEMMKSREWVPKSIEEVGGVAGVGVTFLEETFGDKHAPIQIRKHQEAVRDVLSELLPTTGTNIKGHSRSLLELQKSVGYENKPSEFAELISLLDKNLRLITPADESGQENRSYQLTHDYLVPSLREWLNQKQRETKKGRAELKLAERAATWGANQENKQLPTLVEWFQIRRLTETAKWKASEKSVMQHATRHYLQRIALSTTALVLLACGGWFAWREASRQQEATRIRGLVDTLTNAEPAQIPQIVTQLNADPQVAQVAKEYLTPKLTADGKTPDEQRARLHARLASVARDSSLVEPLVDELLTGKVNYVLPIRQLLKPSVSKIRDTLKSVLIDEKANPQRRFRAALALADYVPSSDEATWTESNRMFVAEQLVSSNAEFQPILREALRPIQDQLLSDLERIFGDAAANDAQRLSAANALADYAANDLIRLTQLLTQATPEQYAVLYPLVSAVPSPETNSQLSEVAAAPPPEDLGSVQRIAFGQRRANAAVTMLRLGEKEKVLPVFDWTDDPEAMTQFIFRCNPRGISVDNLLDLLEITTRRVSEGSSAAMGSDMAASVLTSSTSLAHASGWHHARYALLLALGEYAPTDIPPARREALVKQLSDWYANDPSSGVHGASGWLLRHLGENEIATRIDQTPVPYSPEREWFTLAITVKPTPPTQTKPEPPPEPLLPRTFYYTFIVQPSGEYTISSVEDEVDRNKGNEVRHTVTLTRSFALLDREITFEELSAFSPQYAEFMKQVDAAPNDAGFGTHWYDSVAFCRWLGQEMGLAETDQCYADPETLDKEQYPRDPQETSFPRNWPLDVSKRGFRLPTESEWEVMARGGSRTSYGYGSEVALLDRFGWFNENSGKKVHPGREKRPSVRGLYDLLGNLYEWTHDWQGAFGASPQTDPLGAKTGTSRVIRGGSWGYVAANCRSASRYVDSPMYRNANYGFRLALVPSGPVGSGVAGSGPAEPVSGTGEGKGAEGDRRREE